MYGFIARENIKRFKEQLRNCHDERQRESLEQLLAAEEEKLEQLESSSAARCKQQAGEVEQSQTALRSRIAETERLVSISDEMLVRRHHEHEQDDNQGWPADR